MITKNLKPQVIEIVATIPTQKVMYFGQIADLIDSQARTIGFILTGLTEAEMQSIPWYRVVAKNGYISSFKLGEKGYRQKALLEKENYQIDHRNKVDMNKHLWLFAAVNREAAEIEAHAPLIESLKR